MPYNSKAAAHIASQLQCLLLLLGLHPVCSLLQPQPATLAHPVFGQFLDTFLKGETDGDASALAVKMVSAMACYYGILPKKLPPSRSAMISSWASQVILT